MTNTQNTNENLTVHFKVKDFSAWRTGYQANDKGRASAGITNGRVFCSADDPNEVVVLVAAGKAANLEGERPLPSIARIRTASISDARGGNKPRCART